MNNREKVCCFTGHRKITDEELRAMLPELLRIVGRLLRQGVNTFVTGGALGFDTVAAEVILQLREYHPHLRLIVVSPFAGQADNWGEQHRIKYEVIREMCDEFICLNTRYHKGCMSQRNRYLVDMSGTCIAYCKQEQSGSAYTMHYAEKKGLTVMNLATDYIQLNLYQQN